MNFLEKLEHRNTFIINPSLDGYTRLESKKWNKDRLLKKIRYLIKELKCDYVNRESFSDLLLADIGMVDWCFMKLNKEGLIRRSDIRSPDCEGWSPKWYILNKKEGGV